MDIDEMARAVFCRELLSTLISRQSSRLDPSRPFAGTVVHRVLKRVECHYFPMRSLIACDRHLVSTEYQVTRSIHRTRRISLQSYRMMITKWEQLPWTKVVVFRVAGIHDRALYELPVPCLRMFTQVYIQYTAAAKSPSPHWSHFNHHVAGVLQHRFSKPLNNRPTSSPPHLHAALSACYFSIS
jgi:hypothetical protein